DVAGDGVELRAGVPLVGADPFEPGGAAVENVRHVAQRLDVVDHGGAAERADHGGERGFTRGWPRLPSSDSSIPVSSPQMYAPAPRCTYISSLKPEPMTLSPRMPPS